MSLWLFGLRSLVRSFCSESFLSQASQLAESHFKLLLPQATVQLLRLWLHARQDWMAYDSGQRIVEVLVQWEQPLAVCWGLLDELRPLLLVHSKWDAEPTPLRGGNMWHHQHPPDRNIPTSSSLLFSPGPPALSLCSSVALLLWSRQTSENHNTRVS